MLSSINQVIDKVTNLKYFVLLSTLVFFLDSCLVYSEGVPIDELAWSYIHTNLTLGKTLLFLCVFSLLMAFVVPSLKSGISCIATLLPTIEFFQAYSPEERQRRDGHSGDWISTREMQIFAVRNNNGAAQDLVNRKQQEIKDKYELERLCFGFIVVSIINLFVGFGEVNSLIIDLFTFSSNVELLSFDMVKAFLLMFVYVFAIYIGIIKGCCFQLTHPQHDKINFPRNNINDE